LSRRLYLSLCRSKRIIICARVCVEGNGGAGTGETIMSFDEPNGCDEYGGNNGWTAWRRWLVMNDNFDIKRLPSNLLFAACLVYLRAATVFVIYTCPARRTPLRDVIYIYIYECSFFSFTSWKRHEICWRTALWI